MDFEEFEWKPEATLLEWQIVRFPQIYMHSEEPEKVFAHLNCGAPVCLFGKACGDYRANEDADSFTDGHRLVTGPIIKVRGDAYHTGDTVYRLAEIDKSPAFAEWCEKYQYKEVSMPGGTEQESMADTSLLHICEVCGKEELLTPEEGFERGWDYPPKMGKFGVVSPRTCGDCGIRETAWWEIAANKTPADQLSERHKNTLRRILAEPGSLMDLRADFP